MARSAGKDGVAHDSLTAKPQTHAAGGMPRCMTQHGTAFADLHYHTIDQGKVGFQVKDSGISRMDSNRGTCGLAYRLQSPYVVRMTMR
jgi:hypothetical protein